MFSRKRSSPTATLVIIQGERPDEIEIKIHFDPPSRQTEDPMAFKAMLVAYSALMGALEGTITEIP